MQFEPGNLSFQSLKQLLQRERSVSELEFLLCSMEISENFFSNLDVTLEALIIRGAADLRLKRGALTFKHQARGGDIENMIAYFLLSIFTFQM